MKRLLNYFNQITKIPHCSHNALELKDFLINFAKERNYTILVDKNKNILIKKDSPILCLQAHYDMVCVGDTDKIETFIEDGWIRAKNSTLGADNGIAIAMMMVKMDDGENLEFLFTSDEEVGLLGACALEFNLESKYMLNLDSEDEAEVYIGCAGGVDIEASKLCDVESIEGDFYSLSISGLQGGHSGIQIHENIPNAIKLFADYCLDKGVKIVSIEGGERINSIPTSLNSVVLCENKLIGS
jgi:dipeptidase D